MGGEYVSPPLEPSPAALRTVFEEAMEATIEGWKPQPAQLDERVGSAVSFIASQLTEAASDGATDVFRVFGAKVAKLAPKEAVQATATATWTATDTAGYAIAAGTLAIWLDGFGNRQIFETTEEVHIEAGKAANTNVPMRAVVGGLAGTGLTGTATELVTPLSFVASVTFNASTTGGEEAESDAEYLSRLVEEFQLSSPKPIKATDFSKWLLTKSGVGRVTSIGGFNPTGTVKDKAKLTNASSELTGLKEATTARLVVGTKVTGAGIPAGTRIIEVGTTTLKLSEKATETKENELTFEEIKGEGGYVTSWVGNSAGEELSAERRAGLEAELAEELLAGVIAKVLSASYTTVNVVVTVFAWPGQNAAGVKESVETAIKAYLSPERWGAPPSGGTKEWNNDPKVRLVSVEHVVLQVVGTHYVSSLTLNAKAEDVTMAGVVALPKLGALTVNVENG